MAAATQQYPALALERLPEGCSAQTYQGNASTYYVSSECERTVIAISWSIWVLPLHWGMSSVQQTISLRSRNDSCGFRSRRWACQRSL